MQVNLFWMICLRCEIPFNLHVSCKHISRVHHWPREIFTKTEYEQTQKFFNETGTTISTSTIIGLWLGQRITKNNLSMSFIKTHFKLASICETLLLVRWWLCCCCCWYWCCGKKMRIENLHSMRKSQCKPMPFSQWVWIVFIVI